MSEQFVVVGVSAGEPQRVVGPFSNKERADRYRERPEFQYMETAAVPVSAPETAKGDD
jgi:hypothetical protein